MDDCIFCKIIKKELPAEIVFENEAYLAFMDINPVSVGHTLVIPKTHYQWVWDVPDAGNYFEIAQKIALAQKKAFDTEVIYCGIHGEDIPHAHISVLTSPKVSGDKKDIANYGKKIRVALNHGQSI